MVTSTVIFSLIALMFLLMLGAVACVVLWAVVSGLVSVVRRVLDRLPSSSATRLERPLPELTIPSSEDVWRRMQGTSSPRWRRRIPGS